MHVPFLVRWPGRIPAGSVEEGLVSNEQIGPLLLEAAGLEGGSLPAPVQQVLATTTGQQARQLGMFLRRGERPSQGRPKRQAAAVRLDGAKILAHGDEQPVFYDLVRDPLELTAEQPPDTLADATAQVSEHLDLPPPELDDDQLERLQLLGYMP